ncbi:MAG: hypothetical protein WAU45_00250 [Blastocatellia bacterium]
MDATIGIQNQLGRKQSMACPCCGASITLGVRECSCGARFVGEPLDEAPLKVQRLGPAMTSVLLLATLVGVSLAFTPWLSFAAVVVLWSSWRAVKLARRNPELYGGYRTAVATLSVTILGSAILGAFAISRIPRVLDNWETGRIAATQAAIYHARSQLEDYKRTRGSYPKNTQEFTKVIGESLPADYWERSIKYQSRTDQIADGSLEITGIQFVNFELRSAGPDGKLATDDDVIMRDGIFFTNSEVTKQPAAVRISTDR